MTGLMDSATEIDICNHLKLHLKDGHDKGENPFRVYSLLSAYRIFSEIDKIYGWGYYPSSDGKVNTPLLTIKEILRKSFKSRPKEDILFRHKPSVKRSKQNASSRASAGCDNQFDSIHLNPYYRGKIKGRNFCVIDDFNTHGTSCETVRHLLEKAGADKIIFISLGKYKVTYKKYNYTIEGDVFTPNYTYTRNGDFSEDRGVINNDSSNELLKSLRDYFLC
ncbi:phosphoribosyltransferase [Winogradskyella sp. PAMC22761]|nr:phosphoribosyltransferase [Winogradskyella sp. PAMC22761]